MMRYESKKSIGEERQGGTTEMGSGEVVYEDEVRDDYGDP